MQHFTHQIGNIEGPWVEHDLSRFDFRIVQDVVDQGEQIGPGGLNHFQVAPLFLGQVGIERQVGHADDAVHRRTNFVTHVGQELALGTVGVFGGSPELGRFQKLQLDGVGLARELSAAARSPRQGPPGKSTAATPSITRA